MRRRLSGLQPGGRIGVTEFDVEVNDGPTFYISYKDIFIRRIYHFATASRHPRVLDCGANIGLATLYFKQIYPEAHVVAFEPDAEVFGYLSRNVERNRLEGVELVRAGVSTYDGFASFCSDAAHGSTLATYREGGSSEGGINRVEAPVVRLRDRLDEPVDFLKLNIEGAEHDVLADSADRLHKVRQMVVEYHHLPGLERTLHNILALLHETGFEYLVSAFDPVTNPASSPPFRLDPDTRYYLLVYARRSD
jgi:FkbM family methyltransferase